MPPVKLAAPQGLIGMTVVMPSARCVFLVMVAALFSGFPCPAHSQVPPATERWAVLTDDALKEAGSVSAPPAYPAAAQDSGTVADRLLFQITPPPKTNPPPRLAPSLVPVTKPQPAVSPIAPQTTSAAVVAFQETPVLPPKVPAVCASPAPIPRDVATPAYTPPPSIDAVKQEVWQGWAEKFALLQRENAVLREKTGAHTVDDLGDIRIDPVQKVREDALRQKIATLEKSIEDSRDKEFENAKNRSALQKDAEDAALQALAPNHSKAKTPTPPPSAQSAADK